MYMWLSVIVAVFIVAVTCFLWYLRRNDDYWKNRGVPYYPRQSIISILRQLSSTAVPELMITVYTKYGKVYGGFQFSKPVLSVADPELLRDILVKDFHIFNMRQEISFKDPMLDKMVSVLTGEDWKRVRTIITPAFTSKQMRKMSEIMNECSARVIQMFEQKFEKGEPVDCKQIFGAFTMDVIALSAFATKIDTINDPNNIFVEMSKKIFQEFSIFKIILLSLIPQRLLIYFRLSSLKPMDFFKDVVIQVIQQRRQSKQEYNDILQILMNAVDGTKIELKNEDDIDHYGSITHNQSTTTKYKKLSEDELVAQCILFFSVGYETTASTLAFMAYALALNTQWQDRLIEEVDVAFHTHKIINYDVVRGMKILDSVVAETLRMYPPALGSQRTACEDYELGNTGIVIEKGMIVAFPIYAMHYDAEFFPQPETFNPGRFLDVSHPQYSYLPFGDGPRNCLGMRFALLEIKICMTNVLRHYKFKMGPTTKVPLEYKKFSPFLSVNELPLALEKRNP